MDLIKVEPESDEELQMSSDVKEEEDLGCSLLKSEGKQRSYFGFIFINIQLFACYSISFQEIF
jgi:hypothetical protein